MAKAARRVQRQVRKLDRDVPRKNGRPSPYRASFDEAAKRLCEAGATNLELADFFNVSIGSIKRWLLCQPSFRASVKVGKDVANQKVENALYERACGYEIETEKVTVQDGCVIRTVIREHIPADVGAATFWLKNRDPKNWSDKQEFTGAVTLVMDEADRNA